MAERRAETSNCAGRGDGCASRDTCGQLCSHVWRRLGKQEGRHGHCYLLEVLAARPCRSRSGSSLSRCSLRERHETQDVPGATGGSGPEDARVEAEGLATAGPGRPLGIWPPLRTLRPLFPGSAELDRRLFVPL